MPLYRVRRYLVVEVASTIMEQASPEEAVRVFEKNLPENFLSRMKEHCPPGVEYIADAEEGRGALIEEYERGNPNPTHVVLNEIHEADFLMRVYPDVIDRLWGKDKEKGKPNGSDS